MIVGDLPTSRTTAPIGQIPHLRQPEGLGFGGLRLDPKNRPASCFKISSDGDEHRAVHDPPVNARLQVVRVEPKIGPVALQMLREDGGHPLVDLLAEPPGASRAIAWTSLSTGRVETPLT